MSFDLRKWGGHRGPVVWSGIQNMCLKRYGTRTKITLPKEPWADEEDVSNNPGTSPNGLRSELDAKLPD